MRKLSIGICSLLICALVSTPILAKEQCPCDHVHSQIECICVEECPFKIQFFGCDAELVPCP